MSYKDLKAFTTDIKAVYGAVNEEAALENLMAAKEKWGKKYPNAIKSWEDNWDNLITFFAFPEYMCDFILNLKRKKPPVSEKEIRTGGSLP